MNNASLERIARFLADPHGRPPERLFLDLERLAASAARGTGIGGAFEPADLVSELLQRRCAGEMAEVAWSAIDAAALTGLLRRRFRQLAVELSDGWNGYRALRALVSRLLQESSPTHVPAVAPEALYVGSRLCRYRVAQAVAWLRAAGGDSPPRATALAQSLARIYLPRIVPMAEANDDREEATEVPRDAAASSTLDEQLDADRLRAEWVTSDPAGLMLLAARYRGATLDQLATSHGVALATMHGRVRAAGTRLAERARAGGYSLGAVRACLDRIPVDNRARAG